MCRRTSTAPHRPIDGEPDGHDRPEQHADGTRAQPLERGTATISTTSEIGTTFEARLGEATFSPSTADMTEIAGVIMPSP